MQQPPKADPKTPRIDRHWVALGVMLAVAGLSFVLAHRSLSAELFLTHYDDMRRLVAENKGMALLLFGLVYLVAVSLAMPGSAMLTGLAGLLFGWPTGGLLAIVAAGTGAIVIFLIARTTVGPLLAEGAGARMARVSEGLRSDAASYLLFLRLTPLIPFFLINVAAALVGVPLRTFAWCTYLGMAPASFAFAATGAALDDAILVQKDLFTTCQATGQTDCTVDLSLRTLVTPGLLLALCGLGLLALLPVLLRQLGTMAQRNR